MFFPSKSQGIESIESMKGPDSKYSSSCKKTTKNSEQCMQNRETSFRELKINRHKDVEKIRKKVKMHDKS